MPAWETGHDGSRRGCLLSTTGRLASGRTAACRLQRRTAPCWAAPAAAPRKCGRACRKRLAPSSRSTSASGLQQLHREHDIWQKPSGASSALASNLTGRRVEWGGGGTQNGGGGMREAEHQGEHLQRGRHPPHSPPTPHPHTTHTHTRTPSTCSQPAGAPPTPTDAAHVGFVALLELLLPEAAKHDFLAVLGAGVGVGALQRKSGGAKRRACERRRARGAVESEAQPWVLAASASSKGHAHAPHAARLHS